MGEKFNRSNERIFESTNQMSRIGTIHYDYPEVIAAAQNLEDVLIFRAFRGYRSGFFVDIGAGDPNWDSVTNWLSRVGWRGINVEPNPEIFAILDRWRPRDSNLNVGCSDKLGQTIFYKVHATELGHGWGLSTFEQDEAANARQFGYNVTEMKIETVPLAVILERHAKNVPKIDLLKVDVEGHEAAVLRSGDWRRYRPSLVVVEAVKPMSAVPTVNEWAPILLEENYSFVLFDGINAWFVAEEAPDELRVQLGVSINCNDHFRRAVESDFILP